MKIDILTLFPEVFVPFFSSSILGRALEKDLIDVRTVNIRDYADNKHKQVDDSPYGGGEGMVFTPQPLFSAVESMDCHKDAIKIYLSPKGKRLDQKLVEELSSKEHLILVCGHYEGIDQRFIDEVVDMEISIGDYVLTGGELPAIVLVDAISRLQNGVLKSNKGYEEESFSYKSLLEYPHYTRPRIFRGISVPDVLISGNHKLIDQWRLEKAIKETINKRPDMIEAILKDCNTEESLRKIILKYWKKDINKTGLL